MVRKPCCLFISVLMVLSIVASIRRPVQPAQTQTPIVLRESDPLHYAVVYARRTNNQHGLSQIAIRYAELGDFERAMRVNESATEEDWRTGAYGKIALEYWKQGQRDKARELFLRVASLSLPKDVIYIWGDVIEYMAEAQQFDLALDIDNAMGAAGGTTAGNELATIVEKFIEAKAQNPSLPDILPRVVSIARSLPESTDSAFALKSVAVAYAGRGQHDRATKLIQRFEDEYDRHDGAHRLAIEFARLGLYDRALRLADNAGVYFREVALVGIATEALKRQDKSKALKIVTRTEALLAKARKDVDYEPLETEARLLSELAGLYSQLDQQPRALEMADLSFKTAKAMRKPGERQGALRSAVNGFCELGLYDKALEATKALDDHQQFQFDAAAEVGAHAVRKGQLDAVERIVTTIKSIPVKDDEEPRVRALVAIARVQAEQGHYGEAQTLLLSTMPLVEKSETRQNTPETLKNLAVAFAEVGNIPAALQQIPRIKAPFFITQALIDIGTLCTKNKLTLDDTDLTTLDASEAN